MGLAAESMVPAPNSAIWEPISPEDDPWTTRHTVIEDTAIGVEVFGKHLAATLAAAFGCDDDVKYKPVGKTNSCRCDITNSLVI